MTRFLVGQSVCNVFGVFQFQFYKPLSIFGPLKLDYKPYKSPGPESENSWLTQNLTNQNKESFQNNTFSPQNLKSTMSAHIKSQTRLSKPTHIHPCILSSAL